MNKMRDIRIEKIVLNIGIGSREEALKNSATLLKKISGMEPVITKSKKRSTFNVTKGKPIGCKVTIRKGLEELLRRLLEADENKLKKSSFDTTGNFSFGIKEYINIPGIEYDPSIEIIGFDVAVRLERPGYRVTRKRLGAKLGNMHKITKEEAIRFMEEKFKVEVR